MPQRDPRTNPQPGDIVTSGTGRAFLTRFVTARDANTVTYRKRNLGPESICTIKRWYAWAEGALIRTVAEK